MLSFTDAIHGTKGSLQFPIGINSADDVVYCDLRVIPHLLVSGITGSGTSNILHSIILSLLTNNSPDTIRFVLYDQKISEFSAYRNSPFLLVPIIEDEPSVIGLLSWVGNETSSRLQMLSRVGKRDIDGYNDYATKIGEEKLFRTIIVIDDIVEVVRHNQETIDIFNRIMSCGRAVGIHLIGATHSSTKKDARFIPSFPATFSLSLRQESQEYKRGSATYTCVSMQNVELRTFHVTEGDFEELLPSAENIPKYSLSAYAATERANNVISSPINDRHDPTLSDNGYDEMLPEAVEAVIEAGSCSVSMLQRKIKLGYSRAARLVDQMEELGIVGPYEGAKPRSVVIDRAGWSALKAQLGIERKIVPSLIEELEDKHELRLQEKVCPFCGTSIQESAKFCANCGSKLTREAEENQSTGTGVLRILRRNASPAHDFKTKVFIDGELKGKIKNASFAQFTLDAGPHTIVLQTTNFGKSERTIEISPNSETVLEYQMVMFEKDKHKTIGVSTAAVALESGGSSSFTSASTAPAYTASSSSQICPRCGHSMTVQVLTEQKKVGCLTVLLYIFLFISILGWFVLIPLILRKKDEAVTYAICPSCGYKQRIRRK